MGNKENLDKTNLCMNQTTYDKHKNVIDEVILKNDLLLRINSLVEDDEIITIGRESMLNKNINNLKRKPKKLFKLKNWIYKGWK